MVSSFQSVLQKDSTLQNGHTLRKDKCAAPKPNTSPRLTLFAPHVSYSPPFEFLKYAGHS